VCVGGHMSGLRSVTAHQVRAGHSTADVACAAAWLEALPPELTGRLCQTQHSKLGSF
jgi:hypothetical protein